MRNNESALVGVMSRMITHMGAHIRANHFLFFQSQLGYRKNEPITLEEVKGVIPQIVKRQWLNPAPRDEIYDKYMRGGNLKQPTEDFKGRGKLKALRTNN